jgi:hypothetical protein
VRPSRRTGDPLRWAAVVRTTHSGGRIASLAVVAALLLPASSALAGSEPVATKSGAIVNYTSTGKLKIAKKMFIYFVCSVDCSATSTTTIKGPGPNIKVTVSGNVPANVQGFVRVTPSGGLLKVLKADPGKFAFVNTITATDPATGAVDTISNRFKLKR